MRQSTERIKKEKLKSYVKRTVQLLTPTHSPPKEDEEVPGNSKFISKEKEMGESSDIFP